MGGQIVDATIDPMDLAEITGHRDHRQLMDYYAPDAAALAKKLG